MQFFFSDEDISNDFFSIKNGLKQRVNISDDIFIWPYKIESFFFFWINTIYKYKRYSQAISIEIEFFGNFKIMQSVNINTLTILDVHTYIILPTYIPILDPERSSIGFTMMFV